MDFSLEKFYQNNRRILIWLVLFLLIWLLRDFFGLIFLTFVLAFIAAPLSLHVRRWTRLPQRGAMLAVYLFFLLTLGSVVTFVTPQVVREATLLLTNLPQLEDRLLSIKQDLEHDYPPLRETIPGYLASALSEGRSAGIKKNYREEYEKKLDVVQRQLQLTEDDLLMREDIPATDTLRLAALTDYDSRRDALLVNTFLAQQVELLRDKVPHLFTLLYRASVTTLLALLFSFLISIDLARLGMEVKSLGASRLRDFYEQTAQPVVRFAYVVGRAIRAQFFIAMANTALTFIGLASMGIPSLVMLSFIVFFCSFIPVLGVFISTTPIVLVALNTGGVGMAGLAVGLVVAIHMIEAYLLNPLIYGQHFKINPVLVLMILFVGHHAFGLWGMILGVPVAYYFIHDVFGVPIWDERKLSPRGEPLPGRPLGSMNRTRPPRPRKGTPPHGDAARLPEQE